MTMWIFQDCLADIKDEKKIPLRVS